MGSEDYAKINPTIKVGDVCKTNNDGDVVVLSVYKIYNGTKKCSVMFLDTGNIYDIATDSMRRGLVRDRKRDRTPEFIEKARKLHGDKFGYSKTKYAGSNVKLIITCPEHGDIITHPSTHMQGTGCPKCSAEAVSKFHRHTTEDFVEDCIKRFGDKHDYSQVVYVNSYVPVKIRCEKHGWFEVAPAMYKTWKTGCSMCAEEVRAKEYGISFKEFVKRAKDAHGDRYDYHEEDYTYIKEKTRVTCREHGDWWINGIHHTRGVGCAKCAGVVLKTNEQFIEEAMKVHGDKYDYSKTFYTLNRNKVTIVCPTHGEFKQVASSHLRGSGCSACANTGFDQTKVGSFYVMESPSMIKVGITNRNVEIRRKEVSRNSPEEFKVILDLGLDGWQCRELETSMLQWLCKSASKTTYLFEGSSECFCLIGVDHVIKKVMEVLENLNG